MRLFAFIFFLGISAACAHPLPPLSGTYSSFKHLEGKGGTVGLEVTIVPSGSERHYAYHAVVQTSQGVPKPPQLVPVKFDGTKVVFSFDYAHVRVTLTGKISGNFLVGKLTGKHFSETDCILTQRPGFWQPAHL